MEQSPRDKTLALFRKDKNRDQFQLDRKLAMSLRDMDREQFLTDRKLVAWSPRDMDKEESFRKNTEPYDLRDTDMAPCRMDNMILDRCLRDTTAVQFRVNKEPYQLGQLALMYYIYPSWESTEPMTIQTALPILLSIRLELTKTQTEYKR